MKVTLGILAALTLTTLIVAMIVTSRSRAGDTRFRNAEGYVGVALIVFVVVLTIMELVT